MPSEKIFDLLKQIKMCAIESPDETKEMLIQNPQLAYALLQALLSMNVIDSRAANVFFINLINFFVIGYYFKKTT